MKILSIRVVSSDSSDILVIKLSLPPITVKNYKTARKSFFTETYLVQRWAKNTVTAPFHDDS